MYSGRRVLEVPLYSVFEASRYLQIPENTLRAWVAGRAYPLRSGASRRSDPVIELADPKNSRLSFNNLAEAHILDALRRQYHVELPQIRRALSYLREQFRTRHPLVRYQMLTDGKHLFVEAAGLKDVINASRHGQLAMRDLIGLHLQRIEWDSDGFVARLYPFTRSRRTPAEEASQPRVVTMDPRVEFGRRLNLSYSSSIGLWGVRRCRMHCAPLVQTSRYTTSCFRKGPKMLCG